MMYTNEHILSENDVHQWTYLVRKWCTPMNISCQKSEIIELKNGWKLSVYSFVAVSSTIRFLRVYLDEKLV